MSWFYSDCCENRTLFDKMDERLVNADYESSDADESDEEEDESADERREEDMEREENGQERQVCLSVCSHICIFRVPCKTVKSKS